MRSLLYASWRSRALRVGLALLVMVAGTAGLSLSLSGARTALDRVDAAAEQARLASYDILVRPPGSRGEIEVAHGLLPPDHLTGIAGGIRFDQYEAIRRVPGVEVAAPIAMLGYYGLSMRLAVGAYPAPGVYDARCIQVEPGATREVREVRSTYYYLGDDAREVNATTLSQSGIQRAVSVPNCTFAHWALLAAIDPAQEAALVGLDETVSRRYLESDAPLEPLVDDSPLGPYERYEIPALIGETSGLAGAVGTELVQLELPEDVGGIDDILRRGGSALLEELPPQRVVRSQSLEVEAAYAEMVEGLVRGPRRYSHGVLSVWPAPSPIAYRPAVSGHPEAPEPVLELSPRKYAPPPARLWELGLAPTDGRVAFGEVHWASAQGNWVLSFQGSFDPWKLPLPLPPGAPRDVYRPRVPLLVFDEAGGPLRQPREIYPTLNPFGYPQVAPTVLTTLEGARIIAGDSAISAVRVRVNDRDVAPPDALSRVDAVAEEIRHLTGLQVDVVAGSSTRLVLVHLVGYTLPGEEGVAPAGYAEEQWLQLGVAREARPPLEGVGIALQGAMAAATVLLLLGGGALTSVGRADEFGLLRALGWRTITVVGLASVEAAVFGAVAGLLGLLVGVERAAREGLAMPGEWGWLIVPSAIALSLAGSLWPTLRAVRVPPARALRPAAKTRRPGWLLRRLGYPVRALCCRPGWSLVGGLVGATAAGLLTVMYSVQGAVPPRLVPTVLGGYAAEQLVAMRSSISTTALVVGALGVAGVLVAALAERRGEIALLQAIGWRSGSIARVFVVEGVLLALGGGVVGGAAGVAAAAAMEAADVRTALRVAPTAVVLLVIVSAAAALYPAARAARVPPADAARQER